MSFVDTMDIGSLVAQPLFEGQLKETFRLRGERFVTLKGRHHLEYSGSIITRGNGQGVTYYSPTSGPMPSVHAQRSSFLNSRVVSFL